MTKAILLALSVLAISKLMSQENIDIQTLQTVFPRIYPALPDSTNIDITLNDDDSPVETEFLSDLFVMYAFDRGDHFQIVSNRDLRELSISAEELHEQALKNLRDLNLEIQTQKGERIMMLAAGGDFEATLILLPEVWDSVSSMVEGRPVVSVPARDVVYVTGDAVKENLTDLRIYTSKMIENADKPLSRNFFRWDGLSWTEYTGHAE